MLNRESDNQMPDDVSANGKVMAPLKGLRVLDLSHVVAGPYCSMLLADLGAEVIKIERPRMGEMARTLGPFVTNSRGEKASGTLLRLARNKRGITLDLRKAEGKRLFLDLVKISDVVLENFVPGVMEKLELGYPVLKETNPKIIYASISGFGHEDLYPGPFVDRPSFNLIAQAMGGLMEITGDPDGPPFECGASVGDIFPGLLTAFGILLALKIRETTGAGQHIDTSMYDGMISLNERAILNYYLTGVIPRRGKEALLMPHGAFRTKDGYVAIAVFTNEQWEGLCRAMGREDLAADPSLKSGIERAKKGAFLRPIIEEWTSQRGKNEVTELLLAQGTPAGPVQNAKDILECPHAKARKMIVEIDDPIAGKIKMAGNPLKLSMVSEPPLNPPPLLGQHTQEILSALLRMSSAEIERLKTEGII